MLELPATCVKVSATQWHSVQCGVAVDRHDVGFGSMRTGISRVSVPAMHTRHWVGSGSLYTQKSSTNRCSKLLLLLLTVHAQITALC
jgi:hypothetical protein